MARHIVIVEDEPAIRHNYEDALKRYGYQVTGYSDRESALAALRRRLPDRQALGRFGSPESRPTQPLALLAGSGQARLQGSRWAAGLPGVPGNLERKPH